MYFFKWILSRTAKNDYLRFKKFALIQEGRQLAIEGLREKYGEDTVREFLQIPENNIEAQLRFIQAH